MIASVGKWKVTPGKPLNLPRRFCVDAERVLLVEPDSVMG
jgi:hypothetical protein